MKISFKIIMQLLIVLAFNFGCNGGADFNGASKADKEEDSGESESGDATYEEDTAQEPQGVSGAFLVCAYMENKAAVDAKKVDQNAVVDVGCGLFRSGAKVLTTELKKGWFKQDPQSQISATPSRLPGIGSPFDAVLPMKVKDLDNRAILVLKDDEGNNAKRFSRRFDQMIHYGSGGIKLPANQIQNPVTDWANIGNGMNTFIGSLLDTNQFNNNEGFVEQGNQQNYVYPQQTSQPQYTSGQQTSQPQYTSTTQQPAQQQTTQQPAEDEYTSYFDYGQ